MEVPFVGQVKRLMHMELKNCRLRIDCNGCRVAHHDWFNASNEHVIDIFQKWKNWMLQEPYIQTYNGKWMLKSSYLAHGEATGWQMG
jgi:hypothetical protein